jgi:tetratricopeptide (TPR) repeat protein
MKRKKSVRIILLVLSSVILLFAGYAAVIYTSNKPPVQEINLARETLAEAKMKGAGKYAGQELKEAERLYNESVSEWKVQNEKFFIVRDYALVSELAGKSYQYSLVAIGEAAKSQSKLKRKAEEKLATLDKQIHYFEKYYESLALKSSTRKLFNFGKTCFAEAMIEFRNGDYMKTLNLIFKAEENISKSSKLAHFKLVEFYKEFPVWQKNTQYALNLSKKGQTVFLVDKMDASLIVLKAGREFKKLPVEFGNNWMGDKSMTGDFATPEGIYKVQTKKNGAKTKYHKALLLDYPNNEDRKRYNELVRTGKIPAGKGIGGLIEIHGEGGRGIHWTEGCIALENSDMDVVYNLSAVNTTVIIVGSRQPLNEYLN